MRVVKYHKHSVIRYISAEVVMYNLITIVNTAVRHRKVAKRVDPLISHQVEKKIFFSNLCEMIEVH